MRQPDRARAAGEFAGIVSRNAALFAPLRPRPSHIAIYYNRLSYMTGGNTVAPGNAVRNSMIGFYRAMFERNIQTDFVHADELSVATQKVYLLEEEPEPALRESQARLQAKLDDFRARQRLRGALPSPQELQP